MTLFISVASVVKYCTWLVLAGIRKISSP